MYYNHYQPIQKEPGRIGIFLVAGIFALMASIGMFMPASAAETQTISGDTAEEENDPGWLFNRDTSTSSPYEFTTDEASIGNGSLYVQPIDGSSPSDKFIGEYFLLEDMQDVESISYDFMVGDGGDEAADANQFYMNVYANFDGGTQYGDCVYNVVPDEASGWNTITFNPDNDYDVRTTGSAPETCPDSPSELPEEASLRMFAINAGDTSDNDAGLDGYYDNVVVNTTNDATTFDFEPDTIAPDQVDGVTVLQNGENLGCGAVVNERSATVDWNDSTANDFDHYIYQADDGVGSIDYTTTTTVSERSGNIRDLDGTYMYRIAAVDENGNQGSFSEWCTITLDREAPTANITSHEDGDILQGEVDVRGSVEDENPSHYYAVVRDSSNNVVAGPGTVNSEETFTDDLLFTFDTTTIPDGEYTLWLAARDEAGNRDNSVSLATVEVTVNNTPDNKDQCKKGGWEAFTQPTFRNQGDCVSWMVSDNQQANNPDANRGNRR